MMDVMDISNLSLSVPLKGKDRKRERAGHKKCRSIEKKKQSTQANFQKERTANQQRKLVRILTEDLITQFKSSANISPKLNDVPNTPFIGLSDVINKPKSGLACSAEVDSEWTLDSFGSMIGILNASPDAFN
jgi:hypothetical protein